MMRALLGQSCPHRRTTAVTTERILDTAHNAWGGEKDNWVDLLGCRGTLRSPEWKLQHRVLSDMEILRYSAREIQLGTTSVLTS
jgi:hypothetical protein